MPGFVVPARQELNCRSPCSVHRSLCPVQSFYSTSPLQTMRTIDKAIMKPRSRYPMPGINHTTVSMSRLPATASEAFKDQPMVAAGGLRLRLPALPSTAHRLRMMSRWTMPYQRTLQPLRRPSASSRACVEVAEREAPCEIGGCAADGPTILRWRINVQDRLRRPAPPDIVSLISTLSEMTSRSWPTTAVHRSFRQADHLRGAPRNSAHSHLPPPGGDR
jgi:hypothetical protein